MDTRPPIDRVRENQADARKDVKDAKDALSQKNAKLNRHANDDAPTQESEEQFEKRMREKLKESDDNSG